MTKTLVLVFLAICSVPQAKASVVMMNVYDCGQWVKFRADAAASKGVSRVATAMVDGMAIGSAINIWGGGVAGADAVYSTDQMHLFVDKYCRENPLGHLAEAVHAFANAATNGAYGKRLGN